MTPLDSRDILSCSLQGTCGGCFYHELSYEEELRLKKERVIKLLRPYMDNEDVFEGILKSPSPLYYRNKMEYSFGDSYKGGPLTLGLHRKKSFYDVLDTSSCLLVHDDFNKIVKASGDFFRKKGISYFHKRSHLGYLRHLLVRRAVNTGEILIDLVTNGGMPPDKEEALLKDFTGAVLGLESGGQLKGKIRSILHTRNLSPADAIKDEGTDILYGDNYICEEMLGLKFIVTAFSFIQTNTLAAELLYAKIREYMGKTPLVYDLYSGTGAIAQVISPCAKKVIGVEIVKEAVNNAVLSASLNGLNNIEFIEGDVQKELDFLPAPDMIILDPPRDGINIKALKKIILYGVPYMIYVSCKPESLARDLSALYEAGYRLIRAVSIDQFPRTDNVETVALIRSRTP